MLQVLLPHLGGVEACLRRRTWYLHMWVPDLGLAFACPPGMALSSGADCSAPGISPCPLRMLTGSRPTQGRLNVLRL
eukprot:4974738-Prymnesium_polylepis.1